MNKTKDNSVKSDNNQSNKQTVNKLAKKSYNEEFKAQVIEVYNSGIYATVEECAKGYNVPTNTLHTWLHKSKQSPESLSTNSELARLKKELARAKMENEILKKATGTQCRVRSYDKFCEVRLN